MSEVRKEPVPGRTGGDLAETKQHQDEVSKGQLQDQLADFLFQSTEESFDEEALNALLDALDEADPLPDGLLPDTEESLARFHERYAPVFESVNTARTGSAVPAGKRHSKFAKILLFAAILILLLGTTAQAFGVNVLVMFSNWTSEVFRLDGGSDSGAVIRKNPLAEGECASYDTLEEAVAAFGIDVPLVPKEIPERFELQEVFAENWSNGLIICAEYLSEDGAFQIRYREDTSDINTVALEKEYGNVITHPVKGVTHFLLTDLGREKGIWKSGNLECRIFGNISRAELKGMIDSIYEE